MTERYREDVPPPGGVNIVRTVYEDKFHWPSIVGGAFLALALFVISGVLAWAVGLDYTFRTVRTTGRETGTIIWGGVAALICFGLGGWLAARTSFVNTRRYAMLNGLMVWAVTVPLLVYFLGTSIGPQLGQAGTESQGGPMQASAQFGAGPQAAAGTTHLQAAAWWMLLSLALGLIASAVMGYAGARFTTRQGEVRPV